MHIKGFLFAPPELFYEAMTCCNFIFYLDYCDNPGRIDQILIPFCQDKSVARKLIQEFTETCCLNDSPSAAIGGTAPDGTAAYNDVTLLWKHWGRVAAGPHSTTRRGTILR